VSSLAYCAAEVDAARDRWQRALGFDAEAQTSLSDALLAFASALDAATGLGSRAQAAARVSAADLRRWCAPPSGGALRLEELTARLGESERTLLDALGADAGAEALTALEAEIEADLAPYRGRMPARVLDQIRDESRARRLLARHGIPRLSLFHL
jgi:hypothetical protein